MAMRGGSLASDYPVYWERQGQDKLCAIHTLNTLLQQPVFSEIELAQIAQRLDREEASLLGTSRGSSSHNVDADGNFSLPVMEGALNTRNWCLVNLDKPEIRHAVLGNPQRETAYVCNSHRRAHWYTIRKVHSKWYCIFGFSSIKFVPSRMLLIIISITNIVFGGGFLTWNCSSDSFPIHKQISKTFVNAT
tara:strand:- start:2919 stop:3491 length:573 start_codon:yes stop_codon:yes gene_type:complete